jgi:hypothetical protein
MKQMTLAMAEFERYAKTTRRATFLAEMERVVPWRQLCQLIEPVYPKAGNLSVGSTPMRVLLHALASPGKIFYMAIRTSLVPLVTLARTKCYAREVGRHSTNRLLRL